MGCLLEAREAKGVATEVDRVLHEHGDGHGPHPAGDGGDKRAPGRHFVEAHVAHVPSYRQRKERGGVGGITSRVGTGGMWSSIAFLTISAT